MYRAATTPPVLTFIAHVDVAGISQDSDTVSPGPA